MPQTFILPEEISDWAFEIKSQGKSIGLVPTMGALHEGHLSLIEEAKKHADVILVTIFVNPKQFGPNEDFSKYPRTLKNDIELLDRAGADAVFSPNSAHMYPENFQTFVVNTTMASGLCGASRPGHFQGVLTVVMKLFNLTFADYAVFGKKDYQQFRLIEQMTKDLCIPIHIIGSETVREESGLAKSSRNRYLNEEEKIAASHIFKGLIAARGFYQGGERSCSKLVDIVAESILETGLLEIEYVEICDQQTLSPCGENVDRPPVMLVAVKLGDVRLIDNLELDTGI